MYPYINGNAVTMFVKMWNSLAEQGQVDAAGGAQFSRVFLAFVAAGCSPPVYDFVLANRLDQAPSAQAGPGKQP